ncbi:MAG: GntP family permease [Geminicoccaceae bacterium]
MIGLLGIVLSLLLLMYLAYRGINVLLLAPVLATMAVLFAGGVPVLASYTQVFMVSLGKYVAQFFPLFMLGAIFGKLMDDSGSAKVIANWIVDKVGEQRAILAVVLACAILTYGGVSLFVVAFAVFPISVALFRHAGVPKRLIPGAIALGSFTFTMTALPGTPTIQNAIPAPFFGTTAFAAPGLGIIAALIMFGGGMLWLSWRARTANSRGERYGHEADPVAAAPVAVAGPSFAVAIAPIVVVIVTNYIVANFVLPAMDTSYLAEARFGATSIGSVRGIWAIIVALVVAILLLLALNRAYFTDLRRSLNEGTLGSMLPIFNTASEVGYGATIASLPAFTIIRDAVLNVAPGNPVISLAVAVNVLAGITGSASGGLSIALQTLGSTYVELAKQHGISLDLMHRVATLSSGGFDALPHNGAVITLLGICGLSHRESYADIGMVAVVIPVAALAVVIVLGSLFGSF